MHAATGALRTESVCQWCGWGRGGGARSRTLMLLSVFWYCLFVAFFVFVVVVVVVVLWGRGGSTLDETLMIECEVFLFHCLALLARESRKHVSCMCEKSERLDFGLKGSAST
jgi:hypothetical protein